MDSIDWLRSLHTKQLLALKEECFGSLNLYEEGRWGDKVFSREELQQVLSERPHIPNAAETKQIRKRAAKQRVRVHQSSQ
jgi:hypothetical protein